MNKKLSVALTTLNLLSWLWAVSYIHAKVDAAPAVSMVAGIATMLAAWIQYRSILELRACGEP